MDLVRYDYSIEEISASLGAPVGTAKRTDLANPVLVVDRTEELEEAEQARLQVPYISLGCTFKNINGFKSNGNSSKEVTDNWERE